MAKYSSFINTGWNMAETAALSKQNPYLHLKWPKNPLAELGLTPEEVKTLDFAIQELHREFFSTRPPFFIPPKDVSGQDSSKMYALLKRGINIETPDGEEKENPRRVIVYEDKAFVVLNRKNGAPTIPGGATQMPMKLVYNPISGEKYLKKKIFSTAERSLVHFLLRQNQKNGGFAKIGHVEEIQGKSNYFEKIYASNLTQYYRKLSKGKPPQQFELSSLIKLQESLKMLHETIYHPPRMDFLDMNGISSRCFLGDISPNNCVVEENSEGRLEIRFIDYGCSLHPLVFSLPGWVAPETVNLDSKAPSEKENLKNGTKRDVWQFALLLGTILRGGPVFAQMGNVFPHFSFLTDRMQIKNGRVDYSGLKDLTQEIVDAEIAEFVQKASTPEEKKIWEVIGRWLQVDPERRPSLSDVYISFEEPNELPQAIADEKRPTEAPA